jgi:hypothetical protein
MISAIWGISCRSICTLALGGGEMYQNGREFCLRDGTYIAEIETHFVHGSASNRPVQNIHNTKHLDE